MQNHYDSAFLAYIGHKTHANTICFMLKLYSICLYVLQYVYEVYELRSNVYELRSNVYELRSNVYELRSNVYELCSNVYELRSNVYELCSNVYELRSNVHELRSNYALNTYSKFKRHGFTN